MASTFPTSVAIPEDRRVRVIQILNARLADSVDLKTQAKQAHWNVKGMAFYELHLLFDSVAGHLDDAADLLAERVTALGGVAEGTARQTAAKSSIPEYPVEAVRGSDHLLALSQRLAQAANAMRQNIDDCINLGDQASGDIFIELVRQADKDLWFLQAHLQA
jgi:starvation-inducible DNA-binding protein